jgi:hypothetical protein
VKSQEKRRQTARSAESGRQLRRVYAAPFSGKERDSPVGGAPFVKSYMKKIGHGRAVFRCPPVSSLPCALLRHMADKSRAGQGDYDLVISIFLIFI